MPINDDRIAALWQAVPDAEQPNGYSMRRECTAGHIGNQWWVTAHHCISGDISMLGYLQQSGGEAAGIAQIYALSDHDDVALIKTGEGIDATAFDLPKRSLTAGEHATLLGYGVTNDFASAATTQITRPLTELAFGTATYTNLLEARSVTESRSCNGDSGSPIYQDNTIYAVHTAGGFNPSCVGGQNKLMWHTDLFPRTEWITSTTEQHEDLTPQEQQRAAAGRDLSPDPPIPNPVTATGSSSPLGSSTLLLGRVSSS